MEVLPAPYSDLRFQGRDGDYQLLAQKVEDRLDAFKLPFALVLRFWPRHMAPCTQFIRTSSPSRHSVGGSATLSGRRQVCEMKGRDRSPKGRKVLPAPESPSQALVMGS
jgi:hypothetical protein